MGHEGKPCLKENKGIHLALVGSHCLSWLGVNRCHQNRVQHYIYITCYSAASRNFEIGARSRTHFQKAGQPEYFWATHPFNAKHPFNIYLCITILQEAFISIITNFLFLKNTFKIQKIYYNRFLPFLLSRDKKSRTISSSKC